MLIIRLHAVELWGPWFLLALFGGILVRLLNYHFPGHSFVGQQALCLVTEIISVLCVQKLTGMIAYDEDFCSLSAWKFVA